MATIQKTGAGRWKCLVRRAGWPTQSRTFTYKADATAWGRETEAAIERGDFVPGASQRARALSVSTAVDRYIETVSPTKRPGTAHAESRHARHLKRLLGPYSLAALTSAIIADYRDRRLAEPGVHGRPHPSRSIVRGELILLSLVIDTAMREWAVKLAANPVHGVKKPVQEPGRTRRVSWSELRRLLRASNALTNPIPSRVIRLGYLTAMRLNEILYLRESQIDWRRCVARLATTKNGEARTVPLSQKALAILAEARNCPARRRSGSPLLFPGEPGRDRAIRPYTLAPAWRRIVTDAGIDDLRFHDLRHEATSRLVEKGFSDQEVASITGHKSMQMVRRYTHLRAEDLAQKLDKR